MDNSFSEKELREVRLEMFPVTMFRFAPQVPFSTVQGELGLKNRVLHTISDDVLAECINEDTATSIVCALNFTERAMPILEQFRWRRVEDELPPLSEAFEDDDGDEHRHSGTMLVAYRHTGTGSVEHATAWMFQDGKWYCGLDMDTPDGLRGVIAWMPLPAYDAVAPSTCTAPMSRDEQLREAMEGRR